MCEMYDLKNDYKNVNDEQEISRDLFKRFINFFRERLETKLCQHYFIEQINLLSTENQSDIIDLSNINIQEIIDCLVTFVNNVQRRWPIIKYLIFENDSMKEFVIEKRHMFVKYGIKFCEQFIYDDTLGYLKQNCFSETLQTNIKHSKQIDYPYDEYNRPIQCSITLKKSEQTEKEEELSILIPIDVLFDEFWNGNFPYLVDHVLVLSTAGYLITKFIFATDKYYQESNP
ncbi:unnamed protein product, partial [Didymodactylos carnosus]